MQVKYTTKDTSATTQYVSINKTIKDKVLDDIEHWVSDWHTNYTPAHPNYNDVFAPNKDLPKRGTGNNRGRAQGYNSIESYMGGILDNHRYIPNPKTGKFTSDFTIDNIEWIGIVSAFMHNNDPEKYQAFEFVNDEEYQASTPEIFEQGPINTHEEQIELLQNAIKMYQMFHGTPELIDDLFARLKELQQQ